MCQCGCGEFPVTKGFQLADGTVVGYGVYRGCRECFSGPGVNFYMYPDAKSEWLGQAEIEPYKPDEFGGNEGRGIPVSFFEVQDLRKAAEEIGGEFGEEGYESLTDWLDDNGLEMMQRAMELFEDRIKNL